MEQELRSRQAIYGKLKDTFKLTMLHKNDDEFKFLLGYLKALVWVLDECYHWIALAKGGCWEWKADGNKIICARCGRELNEI